MIASAGSQTKCFSQLQIWACSKSLWQATHRQQLGMVRFSCQLYQENWQSLSGSAADVYSPNNITYQFFPSHLETMWILGRFFWSHSREYFPGTRDLNVHLQLISISWISIYISAICEKYLNIHNSICSMWVHLFVFHFKCWSYCWWFQ